MVPNNSVNNTVALGLQQYGYCYPAYVSLYGTTFTFIVITNSMLIYGFHKTSRPFTTTTKLFIYLSLCEISLISCVFLSGFLFASESRITYMIIFGSIYFCLFMDLFIFWTISFLRFISILKPLYPIENKTVNRILLLDIFISLLFPSAVIFIFIITDATAIGMLDINGKLTIGIQFALVFVNLSINVSSLVILRQRSPSSSSYLAQQRESTTKQQQPAPLPPGVSQKKKKALNTLLLMTILFIVCAVPDTILYLIDFNSLLTFIAIIYPLCQCIQMSNFGINSLIIILRTKKLRAFYVMKFRQVCCWLNVSRKLDKCTELTTATATEMGRIKKAFV